MSVYRELDPMLEHRTQFAFEGKREHIAKVNMPNTASPDQHIDIEIPHGSRDHVIIPDTIKITFNFDIELTGKTSGVVNNVGRGLKARVGAENPEDGTALILTTQENAIKKTFGKRFEIPLDFDFFKYPVYPYGLKEKLIVRLELNSLGKVILCTGDTSAIYKLLDILLEYDEIFEEAYATIIGSMYNGGTSIPYTKVELIHYHTLTKKRLYVED